MRKLFFSAILALGVLCPAPHARAQDFAVLLGEFDARDLSFADKRFLQAALAFEGHYQGLLDGAWGRLSQRAFDGYAMAEFGTPAQDWHMAVLALSLFEKYRTDGWEMRYFDSLGVSFLVPTGALDLDPPSNSFVNLRHSRSSLAISLGVHTAGEAAGFHGYTVTRNTGSRPLYSVRKPHLAVTSAEKSDGTLLYTRSDLTGGAWSTVMILAGPRDGNLLNAVASSIARGPAPSIFFTENGRLHQALRMAMEAAETPEDPPPDLRDAGRTPSLSDPQPDRSAGTGSGLIVSVGGHVLTNAHVIENCRSVRVDGAEAEVLDQSEAFDLAILKTAPDGHRKVAVFSSGPAMLNSDVTVAGYPLAGLLGGLNVTRGSVSSLKGLHGDAMKMQITAPVQPGNSGGPVVGADGRVVGVVVSKLDAVKLADATGDIPQNINFAVRGEIAKLYLSQNGIEPLVAGASPDLTPVDLAREAGLFTSFVECR